MKWILLTHLHRKKQSFGHGLNKPERGILAAAFSEEAAQANLLRADSVFSTELNPRSPCKEFACGGHILYRSCLLSSG